MRRRVPTLMMATALFCVTGVRHVSAQLPALDTAYPFNAEYVPPGGDIQKALKKRGIVRLGAGTYKGTVTLRSKQRIYGIPGSHVHHIEVEPGTQQAVLWRVNTNLRFPPGKAITKHNIFIGIGKVVAEGACLEGNLFLDMGGVTLDFSKSGYLRNSRVIRTVMQGPRQLIFKGNTRTPSYNNVWLWFNPLCPQKKPMYLENLQDITFVGVDAELWLSKSEGAMFHTGRMGTLRIFGAQGGENSAEGRAVPILDTGAEEVQIYGLTPHCPKVKPNMILREGNKRLFTAGCRRYSRSIAKSNNFDLNVFEWGASGNDTVRHRGVTKKSLRAVLIPKKRKGVPWERPSFPKIPDPAGQSWQKKLAKAPDHTAMLQKRIDEEGIAILAPGKYYISEPLRISHTNGIIGAGMDRTVIIAKKPGMSLFYADSRKKTSKVTLANVTLQGGAVGLHIRAEDIPGYISCSYISHVQFRDMSVAGIHVDMVNATAVEALDNNVLTYCIFYRCGSGVKQSPARIAGFLDKNLFYNCQFVECDYGLELPARRQNNLNSCINCLFKGCRINAAKLISSSTTTFANCDFIDNAGDPVISSNRSIVLVSCRFKAGLKAKSLLPPAGSIEGCTFEAAGAIDCDVVNGSRAHHFYNCSSDMPVGSLYSGMLVNNDFAADKAYSQLAVVIYQGGAQTVIEGETSPSPQMLFGANLGSKKQRKKQERVVRRPSPDAVAKFNTLLRKRLSAALVSGNKVTFPKKGKTVLVNAIDESGKLQVTFTQSKKTASVAFKRLSYVDRLCLASALLQGNDEELHSLVAFYALCTNNIKLARRHLEDSGDMAAHVQTMFVTK